VLERFRIAPTLAASDIDRARQWYTEKLGLGPTVELPGGLIFPAGGEPLGFGVYLSPNAGSNRATYATWLVDDLDAVMGALRERGVRFEDYATAEVTTVDGVATSDQGARTAWFTDSEGTILSLSELPASMGSGSD
jgi:catechol 2,3-dioxygenase-like lactoylglutathione lyase family enzyme